MRVIIINTKDIELITELNTKLGIDLDTQLQRGLQLFPLAINCVSAGTDYYNREAFLEPNTLLAWQVMAQSALNDKVELYICSAFRPYVYQFNLINTKLSKGQNILDIITVLAPPGFSEHHTGCAIDIMSPEIPELSEQFENTLAFAWLQEHANDHGFYLSYPRNNSVGVIYEPWHWRYYKSE